MLYQLQHFHNDFRNKGILIGNLISNGEGSWSDCYSKKISGRAKNKNTLVSGNAGDEKNLRPSGRKFIFFSQFN